jgi:selenocysteine lyase/cysteine desulfurase
MDRRRFLLSSASSLGALDAFSALDRPFTARLESYLSVLERQSVFGAAENEDFWGWIRQSYTISANLINLNNGGVSPQPRIVQEAHIRHYEYANEAPTYYMWRILDQQREGLRQKLAGLCGVLPEEIAINRNTTEGLSTVIFGLDLSEGDEVVLSTFDYPNMVNAWKQREKRDKIKLVWINIPQPVEDHESVVRLYEAAITPRTKIVHITHLINWTGNILPCRAIADMAHKKGCEVIVDGAHSLAHIDFRIEDTGADYFASSLHKWLGAPFGSGLLYIRKNKIKNIWPLVSSPQPEGDGIRKFENLGTRSFASEMAIGTAIDFHNIIGTPRKEARLRYLKNYWAEKAVRLPKTTCYTSLKDTHSCAIAAIGIEGWHAHQIEARLFEKYKIHSVSIVHENVNGIRITPHVYTSLSDLDLLVKGLSEISQASPPAGK